MGPQAAGS